MEKLKFTSPETPVLLTTNPSVLKNGRGENPNAEVAAKVIRQMSETYGVSLWDQKTVTG